jgi:5-methyltetrahydrofolate--homocysteine methyltransferase
MRREEFKKALQERVLFLDGGYGTEFFKRGFGGVIELLNLTDPHEVEKLQEEYALCGVDILLANTFSANRAKLESHGLGERCEAMNRRAVEIAKKAARGRLVFGDISSTGRLMEPLGDLSFEEAVRVFREQATFLVDAGVDGIIVETMSDIKELKASIVAVRELSADIPLVAQMTFEADGNSVTGTSVEIFATLVNDLDVDAAGINCSLTPEEMLPLFRRLAKACTKPLSVEPNAGRPFYDRGRLCYGTTPEEFAINMADFVETGANIVGGCCGTGPEHIKLLTGYVGRRKPVKREVSVAQFLSSRTVLKPVKPFLVIGERINASGKKDLQRQICEKDFSRIISLAQDQEQEGAAVIDINLGIEKLLKKEHFIAVVNELDRRSALPLSFDIQNLEFLEAAMREYPGRGLINSATAREDHLIQRLDLLKKYGGMLIVLAMEKDIPEKAEERFGVVQKAVKIIKGHGTGLERIFFDPLVLPVGAKQDYRVTLETVKLITAAGLQSSIGLSNLSFGLPGRDEVNAAFLSLCVEAGLKGAIMNTAENTTMGVLQGALALNGVEVTQPGEAAADPLVKNIIRGRNEEVMNAVKKELEKNDPLHVSQCVLAEAMEEVGRLYALGKIFLPHLILAAETVQPVFEYLNGLIGETGAQKAGKVLLATVEGDIHDIGKNIVATVLRSGRFEVTDIGKDVTAEMILEAVKKENPDVVGLSAMMTTTVGKVKEVADLLKAEGLDVPVIAGGASMSESLAEQFGVRRGKDAMEALALCREIAGTGSVLKEKKGH